MRKEKQVSVQREEKIVSVNGDFPNKTTMKLLKF